MNLLKTSRILIFLLAFINAFDIFADMSSSLEESKMAPPPMVQLDKVLSFYKTKEKTAKLTNEEIQIFELSQVAKEIFSVTQVQIRDYGVSGTEKELKAVTLLDISLGIQNRLRLDKKWQKPSDENLAKILKVENSMKQSLGDQSYLWAWLQFQKGDQETARKILNQLFTTSYDQTMKLKHLGFRDSDPLYESTTISEALTPLSTPAENKERDAKIKKMKVHLSNLPDMQIMT